MNPTPLVCIWATLYRDMEIQGFYVRTGAWHSAIYTGFTLGAQGRGAMTLVHAYGDLASFYGDVVVKFEVDTSFASPNTDVASTMAALRDAFIRTYAPTSVYHGARTAPGITPVQRRRIADTALQMLGKNIAYTWMDMLRHYEMAKPGAS